MYWLYTRQPFDADYYSFAVICTLPFLGAVANYELPAASQMAHGALCELMIQAACLIAARPRHMSNTDIGSTTPPTSASELPTACVLSKM